VLLYLAPVLPVRVWVHESKEEILDLQLPGLEEGCLCANSVTTIYANMIHMITRVIGFSRALLKITWRLLCIRDVWKCGSRGSRDRPWTCLVNFN